MKTELFVSRSGGRTFVVIREDGETAELHVEADDAPPSVGRIVKARVSSLLPGIQSAFLEAGLDRAVFLHANDLLLPDETGHDDERLDWDEDTDGGMRVRRPARSRAPIQDVLTPGRELLVQVSRDALQTKGARVTCDITLAGRYLVLLPYASHRGVSRRISDAAERERLRREVEGLPHGDVGFIVRTAGERANGEALRADAEQLVRTWHEILARAEQATAPAVVHQEPGLALRVLRDVHREGVEQVVIDDPATYETAREYLRKLDPLLATRLRLHAAEQPLLEAYDLDTELERALRPRVWLRSGGTLVLEQTEALVSIDVNTGKSSGRLSIRDTVLRTNLEAAVEIARQLRLRDLGGIIVIDFIDMESADHRTQVTETLREALRRDRARTKVVGLSELGLLQLTRKRTRQGPAAQLTRVCPACAGLGRVKDPATVAAEALAEIRKLRPVLDDQQIRVRAHPDVALALRRALHEAPCDPVDVEDDPASLPDRFDVVAW